MLKYHMLINFRPENFNGCGDTEDFMVYPIQLAALCTCMYIENCTSRRKSIRHDFASSKLHTKEQTVHALKIQYHWNFILACP